MEKARQIVQSIVDRHRIGDAEILDGLADVADVAFEGEFGRVDADDHQPVFPIAFVQRFDVGDGADAVDAAVGPEVDQHDLAPELLAGQRRRVQPGDGAVERGQGALVPQALAAALHRHAVVKAERAGKAAFDGVGLAGRKVGEDARVEPERDDDDGAKDEDAQAAADPLAGAERALHRREDASADEQRKAERGGRTKRIGEEQQGGAGTGARQGRAGQDQAEDRSGAGRPEQAGGQPKQQRTADALAAARRGQPLAQADQGLHRPVGEAGENEQQGEAGEQDQGDGPADAVGLDRPAAADGRQAGDGSEGDRHADQQRQPALDEGPVGAGEDEGQDRQDAGAEDRQHAAEISEEEDHGAI